MIIVYKPLTSKQLKDKTAEAITGVKKFFENNPKKKVCRAKLWYGDIHTLKRNSFEKDIENLAALAEVSD